MKLRMYLRGLGLGMIVTALVLSFGLKSDNNKMTDAWVRARAKELGMVDESTTLKDNVSKEQEVVEEASKEALEEKPVEEEIVEETPSVEEVTEEKPVKEETEEEKPSEEKVTEEKPAVEETVEEKPVEKTDEELEAEKEAVKKEAEEAAKKAAKEAEEAEKASKKETDNNKALKAYSLRIEKGYSSDRVAKILEDAGVVGNAASFDKYLCSNGYDHRISVGTYQIPAGADYLTIAKLITHSN